MHFAHDYLSRREKVMSGAFALGMHALFLLLLLFGVTWQKKVEPQANIVDLYARLPALAKPEPPPRPEPKPEPRVEPKPEPKPVAPPPKAVPRPEVKPDIALKEKAIKEKAEKEKRQLDEKQKAEKKRADEAKADAAKQQKAKEAEAQRALKEQEDAQRKIAAQAAAARKNQMDRYEKAIRDRIKRFIVLPPNLQGNPEAEFEVIQLPGGEVLGAKLKRSSGNAAYDSAVERAILKAQPLPAPPDPSLFTRELNLVFRPQE